MIWRRTGISEATVLCGNRASACSSVIGSCVVSIVRNAIVTVGISRASVSEDGNQEGLLVGSRTAIGDKMADTGCNTSRHETPSNSVLTVASNERANASSATRAKSSAAGSLFIRVPVSAVSSEARAKLPLTPLPTPLVVYVLGAPNQPSIAPFTASHTMARSSNPFSRRRRPI